MSPVVGLQPRAGAGDADFDALLGSLVSESLEAHRQQRPAGQAAGQVHMPTLNKLSLGPAAGAEGARAAQPPPGGFVGLKLLTKKGAHKTKAADLLVPEASGLAQAHLRHEASELEERQRLKKLVLQRAVESE